MSNAGNNDPPEIRPTAVLLGASRPSWTGGRGAGCDMGETAACGEALRFVSLRDSEFVSAGMMAAKVSITAQFIIDQRLEIAAFLLDA